MSVASTSSRQVVFHADDFGMNAAVNRGILNSFRDGVLTSTSLLANAPAAEIACHEWPTLVGEYASNSLNSLKKRRELGEVPVPFDLGIHLNLTQGRPLTGNKFPSRLLDESGHFRGVGALFYRLKLTSAEELRSVAAELTAQIDWMCDRGLRPSHLNGHQYVELIPQISAMIPEFLTRYKIPVVRVAREPGLVRNVLLRGRAAAWGLGLVKLYYASAFRRRMHQTQVAFPDRFFGTSHAGRIDQQVLTRFFLTSPNEGCTEIGLHPAEETDAGTDSINDPWFDPLSRLRSKELDWLCGAELPMFLKNHGVTLSRLKSLTK